MLVQSDIRRTLNGAVALKRLTDIVSQEEYASRSALSRRVCAEFSFFDAAGRSQLATCSQVLVDIATRNPFIVIPAPQTQR